MSEIVLQVSEPDAVELEYVEAKIKPEVVGHATPTYEQQTVNPVDGTTFGSFVVEPIHDPTAIKEISTNGDHDVARYGTARVDVQPTLQQKTITPTEQQQTVEADSGYDGLSQITVNRIPNEYIVPSGAMDITANADGIDVTDKASVNVNVPVPVMPDEYAIGGSYFAKTITGYKFGNSITEIPGSAFYQYRNLQSIELPNSVTKLGANVFYACSNLERITLSTALTVIGGSTFRSCVKLKRISIPDGVTVLNDWLFNNCVALEYAEMPIGITTIWSQVFSACTNLQTIDFTKAQIIPQLNGNNLLTNSNPSCKIVVPDSLYNDWIVATNWVSVASHIIKESDYNA